VGRQWGRSGCHGQVNSAHCASRILPRLPLSGSALPKLLQERTTSPSPVAAKTPRYPEWPSPRLTPAAQRRRDLQLSGLRDQASHLANIRENDNSLLALRPHDPGALQQLCLTTLQAAESAPAHSTTKADDLAWERLCAYCDSMGTPPLRVNSATSGTFGTSSAERETALLTGFLLYLAVTTPGRGCIGSSKPQLNF